MQDNHMLMAYIEQGFANLTVWVYRRKFSVLFLLLVFSVALAIQSSRLTFDTRDESFFHEDDPTMVSYNAFRDKFGQDDTFIISLKPDGGLTSEFFTLLHEIHTDLEAAVPYLDDISSLVNGRIIRAEDDTLIVEELLEHPPASKQDIERLLNLIDRYPLYDRLLISPDRTMAIIMIRAQAVAAVAEEEAMSGFDDASPVENNAAPRYLSNDENIEINAAISRVLDAYQERGVTFYKAGTPVFVAEITAGIMEDLSVTVPLSLALIILFLTILFRKISGVIFPLLVVALLVMVYRKEKAE
jgi:predicted RND superfamily exporter protein